MLLICPLLVSRRYLPHPQAIRASSSHRGPFPCLKFSDNFPAHLERQEGLCRACGADITTLIITLTSLLPLLPKSLCFNPSGLETPCPSPWHGCPLLVSHVSAPLTSQKGLPPPSSLLHFCHTFSIIPKHLVHFFVNVFILPTRHPPLSNVSPMRVETSPVSPAHDCHSINVY